MSDKHIPERWRKHYEFLGEEVDNCLDVDDGRKLIEELGTAESLVRDLAGVLQEALPIVGAQSLAKQEAYGKLTSLLSRIPKELLNG